MSYRRAAHVAWRKVGEETVLVDLRRNLIFGLNDAGGALWAGLDEAGDVVPGSHGEAGSAVRAFLAELTAAGLVEEVAGSRPAAPVAPSEAHPGFGTPVVAWRETLEAVAATCAFHAGQGGLCDPQPGG